MKAIRLDIGCHVSSNNTNYEIVGIVSPTELLCMNLDKHDEKRVLKISDIKPPISESPKKSVSYLDIDENLQQLAKKRYEIIKPLLDAKERTRKTVENRAKECKVSTATVYRMLSAFEQSQMLSSLVPQNKVKGINTKTKLNSSTEAVVESVLNERYLNEQKYSLQHIYREITQKCTNAGVKTPHINTIRNRIEKLDPKTVEKRRHKNSVLETRGMPDRYEDAEYPLSVVQIDHTKMDIILVDEITRKEIGRPYITLAIDVFSRMVAGFYISLEPPSFFNIGQCLINTVLPKDKYLQNIGVSGDWPIYGLPRTIHTDNGRDFRSIDLQKFCEEYRIEINFRPVGRSHFGGHIERLMGTTERAVHALPGTTFSNITQKGKYDSQGKAAFTISEIEQWFAEYIVNIYNKTLHKSIGMSPEEKYIEGIYGLGGKPPTGLPVLIEDNLKLRASLLPSIERSIQKTGVTIDYVTYFSDVLRRWIKPAKFKSSKKYPSTFIFRRNPSDIGKIYFEDPELKEYFVIPYRNLSNPNMNLSELRATIAQLQRRNGTKPIAEHDIFDAYEKLKRIEEKAVTATKTVRRQESSKKHLARKNKPLMAQAEIQHKNNSAIEEPEEIEIEYFDVEIIDNDSFDTENER